MTQPDNAANRDGTVEPFETPLRVAKRIGLYDTRGRDTLTWVGLVDLAYDEYWRKRAAKARERRQAAA